MTDRELLEMAAKAAGLEICWRDQRDRDECGAGEVGLWLTNGHTCWNPLTDDGDALRLAVKLDLEIRQVHFASHAGWANRFWATERHGGDPYAATRRCIVRAAAEIGRTM